MSEREREFVCYNFWQTRTQKNSPPFLHLFPPLQGGRREWKDQRIEIIDRYKKKKKKKKKKNKNKNKTRMESTKVKFEMCIWYSELIIWNISPQKQILWNLHQDQFSMFIINTQGERGRIIITNTPKGGPVVRQIFGILDSLFVCFKLSARFHPSARHKNTTQRV